jgi:DnaJ family protein C protein 19
MLKFIVIAAGIVLIYRWAMGRWPWEKKVSVGQQAAFNARRLLGLGAVTNRAEIIAAHKRRVAVVHPDRGGTNRQVHEANDARDLLLNELPNATLEADQEQK